MGMLLQLGLANAAMAAALALVAAAAGRVCRRPAVVHSLWLLVLLKLVTPPVWRLQAPAGLAPPSGEAARAVAISGLGSVVPTPAPVPERTEAEAAPAEPLAPAVTSDLSRSAAWTYPPPAAAPAAVPVAPAAWRLPRWQTVVVCLWTAGSVAWLGLAVVRIARFGRLLRHARPAPEALQAQAGRLAQGLGLKRSPGVWLVPGCVSPLLWAVGSTPRLLVPQSLWDQLDADQQAALLVHELAHLRRRDHWVRRLELVVTCLYWWHPAVWWARRALREAEEQCCDAWVVWALPASARSYATALLQTLDFLSQSQARPLPLTASGAGHLSCLKRRLTMIMQETTPRTLSWVGRLGVLGLAAVLLPVGPSWGRPAVAEGPPEGTATAAVLADDDDQDKDRSKNGDRDRQKADDDEEDARQAERDKARAEVRRLTRRLEASEARFQEQVRQAQEARAKLHEELAEAQRRLAQLEGQPGLHVRPGAGFAPAAPGMQGMLHRPAGVAVTAPAGMAPPHAPMIHGAPVAPVAVGGPPHGPMVAGAAPHAPGAMAGYSGFTPMVMPHAAIGDTERRLSELEKKLDRVLEEFERMKERGGSTGRPREGETGHLERR